MAKRIGLLLVTVVILLGNFGTAAFAQTETSSFQEGTDAAAPLFDPLKPFSISLMHQIGEPALTHNYLDNPTYRRASVKITMSGTKKYKILYNIGVRLKGSYTRRFDKMSMKIRFDAFVKGQTFMGLKRLTLNAMMQDESQIRELTAYRLFRAMGVPASRAGYTRVSVDGAYQGLYLNLESVDSKMLKRWFTSSAHLYSGPRPCDITPTNSCYTTSLGTLDRTDVLNAGRLHLLSGKKWWTEFQKISDSERVLKMLATEIFISHWDGYGDYMLNNHYVQFDKEGRFTLIPYGTDQTFPAERKHQLSWDASKPVYYGSATIRSTLLTHCLDYRACQDRLLAFGFQASQIAKRINLIGFKDQVVAKISQKRFAVNDVSRVADKTRQSSRKWITDYLTLSNKALSNFLLLRSPAELRVAMPSEAHLKQVVRPRIEPIWEPGVTASYQWFLDSAPIPKATSSIYKVLGEQLGHKLKLRVTLKKSAVKETVFFTPALKILLPALRHSPIPVIAGKAKIGKTLTSDLGVWDDGVTLTLQWYRNGNLIENANKTSYKISNNDFGQHITLRVTGTKPNFFTTLRESEPTKKVD